MTTDLVELKNEENTLRLELQELAARQMGLITREKEILTRISTIYTTYAAYAGGAAPLAAKDIKQIDSTVRSMPMKAPTFAPSKPISAKDKLPLADYSELSRPEQVMQVIQENNGKAHVDVLTRRIYGEDEKTFKLNKNRMSSILYNMVHKTKTLKQTGGGNYSLIYGK